MANNRTYIKADDTLYIDGKLVVKGNVYTIDSEFVTIVDKNDLSQEILTINSDKDYLISQIVFGSNSGLDGNIFYTGSKFIITPEVEIPELDVGNLQVDHVYVTQPGTDITVSEMYGNVFTGNAAAAGMLTYPVHVNVVGGTYPTYDVEQDLNQFRKANDIVSLNVILTDTGLPAGEYGADNSTVVTYNVDSKGRIISATTDNIQVGLEQVIVGGGFNDPVANAVYDLFTAGIGITYTGTLGVPQGEFSITNTTVVANSYGTADSVATFTVNPQGQLTGAQDVLIDITSHQVNDFNAAITSFISADYGLTMLANGSIFVDIAETATLADDQTYAGNKIYNGTADFSGNVTFTGTVDLTGAVVPGFTITGDTLIDGNLNVLGNVNSITRTDILVEDNKIVLNSNSAVAVDSFVTVKRGASFPVELKWDELNLRWEFTNNGVDYYPIPVTTSNLLEGVNLYYTADRANTAMDNYLVGANGIHLVNGATNLEIHATQGDGILVDTAINVDNTVIRTSGDQSIADTTSFTGNLVIPDSTTSNITEGAIYTQNGTNTAYVVINGTPIEITPSIDYGTIDNAPGAGNATVQVFAGNYQYVTGNATVTVAGIKGISVGANMSITETGNVITLDADGLNQSEVYAAFGHANNGGFGSISYDNAGTYTYTGVTVANIRNQLSGTGLISYAPATGVISTSADNYANWNVQTDSGIGSAHSVTSNSTLAIQGVNGVTVTNVGNVISISGLSADITSVDAGAGLTGGGSSGAVTLDVGAGSYIIVNANNIAVDATTTATASKIVARDVSGDVYANVFHGVATSAQYADLAEMYTSDEPYEPGTVVVFGGEAEVTQSTELSDYRVAGVVSTNPAHLMNSECEGVAIALRGRVPVKVIGPVHRGDILVTSNYPGHAYAALSPKNVSAVCVIGKAITSHDSDGPGIVEVMV